MSFVRSTLKTETRALHDAAESTLGLMQIDSRPDYIKVLKRLHGFYMTWEHEIARPLSKNNCDIYAGREKLPLLKQDLRVMGEECPEEYCTYMPDLQSLPATLGSLYVIEGSTLGGKFIAEHLYERLHITSETGSSFFSSYRDNVGQKWKEFCQVLEREAVKDVAGATHAARQTFQCFNSWLIGYN